MIGSKAVEDLVASATGSEHRDDPVVARTGGPAGNARLTAWTGLLLLVAFVVECVTLLSLHAWISVHIFVGAFLVPLVLVKTATTGWRIVRYYGRSAEYQEAGPPPLLLRLLGPLVVVTGIAVLGSGLALIPLGQDTFTSFGTFAGHRIDPLTIHQLCFVVWLVTTGAHVLARTIPALQLAGMGPGPRRLVPGKPARIVLVAATLAVAAVTGTVVVNLSSNWTSGQVHREFRDDGGFRR